MSYGLNSLVVIECTTFFKWNLYSQIVEEVTMLVNLVNDSGQMTNYDMSKSIICITIFVIYLRFEYALEKKLQYSN